MPIFCALELPFPLALLRASACRGSVHVRVYARDETSKRMHICVYICKRASAFATPSATSSSWWFAKSLRSKLDSFAYTYEIRALHSVRAGRETMTNQLDFTSAANSSDVFCINIVFKPWGPSAPRSADFETLLAWLYVRAAELRSRATVQSKRDFFIARTRVLPLCQ